MEAEGIRVELFEKRVATAGRTPFARYITGYLNAQGDPILYPSLVSNWMWDFEEGGLLSTLEERRCRSDLQKDKSMFEVNQLRICVYITALGLTDEEMVYVYSRIKGVAPSFQEIECNLIPFK